MTARLMIAAFLLSSLQGCMLAALPIWPSSGMHQTATPGAVVPGK